MASCQPPEDGLELSPASTVPATSRSVRLRRREFAAAPEAPFADDLLDREEHVKGFCSLLTGAETPFVVSLDGSWGTGKTAFVKMCAAWLRSEAENSQQPVDVVEFNAWTEGYSRSALTDLVDAVTIHIANPRVEALKQIAKDLLIGGAEAASGGALKHLFEKSDSLRTTVARFKASLEDLAHRNRGRLIVFVDELDRCRPDYALDVLETVRHLFDVPGVCVVLATNREALDQSVRSLYGPAQDGERYMRRFVDQAVRLPSLSDDQITAYLRHLYEETGLSARFIDEGQSTAIFELFIASEARAPRDIEQAVHRVAVVLASIPAAQSGLQASNPFGVWDQAAMTMLMLRAVDRDSYERFTNGQADACDIGQALRSERLLPLVTGRGASLTGEERRHHNQSVRAQMQAALLMCCRGGSLPAAIIHEEHLQDRMKQNMPSDYVEQVWKAYHRLRSAVMAHGPDIDRLSAIIEMTAFDPAAGTST